MKRQSPNLRNIAGGAREARDERIMTAEVLSFEPVYVDGCTLAPTISMARTMRFKQLGIAKGKQPTGTTVDASCGNPLCFAARACTAAAVEEFWREVGSFGNEARKAAGGRVYRPARLPLRYGIKE